MIDPVRHCFIVVIIIILPLSQYVCAPRWSRRPYAKPEIWNWQNLNSAPLFPEQVAQVIIISRHLFIAITH